MDDIASVEAQRLHRYHCVGCSECRYFEASLPGPATRADMEAFGPGEDYEGREAPHAD